MLTIHLCAAPLGLDRYSPDNLRCLTAPARVVTALIGSTWGRLCAACQSGGSGPTASSWAESLPGVNCCDHLTWG